MNEHRLADLIGVHILIYEQLYLFNLVIFIVNSSDLLLLKSKFIYIIYC